MAKNPYDSLEEDDLDNLAEWNGAPLLGRKNIGTDNNHSGPPKPTKTIHEPLITHDLGHNSVLSHPLSSSDACSYCEAMK